MRIVDAKSKHFYIDKVGTRIPISEHASARVPIANGNIRRVIYTPENFKKEIKKLARKNIKQIKGVPLKELEFLDSLNTVDSLLVLTNYIQQDSFLKAQIDQIYVDSKQEFMLVPKVGRHKIIFGSLDNMKDKFLRLKVFYKKALPHPDQGWRKYKRINLKFDKQVVGIK